MKKIIKNITILIASIMMILAIGLVGNADRENEQIVIPNRSKMIYMTR